MNESGHRLSTWWRRQRLAVMLLPLILMAAVAASSMYVHDYWWVRGFHSAAPVAADGSVTISDEYDDGYLRYPIRATVRLEGAERVTELPGAFKPMELPSGAALWEVRLAWDADPDVSLSGCQVALLDRDGSRFDSGTLGFDAGAPLPIYECVPDDTPGPKAKIGSTSPPAVEEGQDPRPQKYLTKVYVLTSSAARPESVRVWWYLPRYADLPLT